MESIVDENRGIWLTPTGAGIALICFFLPWIEFSCGTMTGSISGAEMGGVMWVVFVAALLSLLAFYYFRNYDELDRAKPVVVLSGLTAIAIMVYKFFNYKSGVGCCQGGWSNLVKSLPCDSYWGIARIFRISDSVSSSALMGLSRDSFWH
jgi:hypothetical protein